MNDPIQEEIEARACLAPRVTPADLEAEITSEHYFTALDGVLYETGNTDGAAYRVQGNEQLALLTFCTLVLCNGFTVTGQSACVSAKNFDADIGRKIARQNAINQLWPLLGFRLADRQHALKNGPATIDGGASGSYSAPEQADDVKERDQSKRLIGPSYSCEDWVRDTAKLYGEAKIRADEAFANSRAAQEALRQIRGEHALAKDTALQGLGAVADA